MKRIFKVKPTVLIVAIHLFSLSAIAQAPQIETIPIDPQTNKVTISGVIEVPGLSRQDIYSRVDDWYQLCLHSIKKVAITRKDDVDGPPQLIMIVNLRWDLKDADSLARNGQKLMYKVGLAQIKYIGAFGSTEMSGYELANLVILIKDGKFKYECTEFVHRIVDNSMYAPHNGEGLAYDLNVNRAILSQKNWDRVRIEGLNKYNKLIYELIDYVKKPTSTDMNF